jgi:hypothetical protein
MIDREQWLYDQQFAPESVMKLYPYGAAMSYGHEPGPIVLFHGDDYGFGRDPRDRPPRDPKTAHQLTMDEVKEAWVKSKRPLAEYNLARMKYPDMPYSIAFTLSRLQSGKAKNIQEALELEEKSITDIKKKSEEGLGYIGVGDVFALPFTFTKNTVDVAGKTAGFAVHTAQDALGVVGKAIGEIPIIGGAVEGVFDLAYHSTLGMADMAVGIVFEGKRIDKAILGQLETMVKDIQQVAPYAQMVISVIPGIGTGVSAALSAGLALAQGQPIDEVLKAGMIGALPGGPLVKAGVTTCVETIQQVARGEKVDLGTIMHTAGGVAASALGLPAAAAGALVAGVATVGNIATGQPLDKALTDAAIQGLPINNQVKSALTDATAITVELAQGKPLDKAVLARIDSVANRLPSGNPLKDTIKTAISTVKNVASGGRPSGDRLTNPTGVMATALQSGIADNLVSMGAATLPEDIKKSLKSGIAVGTGLVAQAKRGEQLTQRIPGKLAESGIQLAKADPLYGAARRIAATQGGTKGFDIANGLLQHKVGTFDVATVRNALTDIRDKMGFDMAAATRIGAVANPKPRGMSPAAVAGNMMTKGMQSYIPGRNQAIMAAIQNVPSAAVGAKEAVKEIAKKRGTIVGQMTSAITSALGGVFR